MREDRIMLRFYTPLFPCVLNLFAAIRHARAVQLGAWLWFGFVFMILVGAVVWDNVPWKLTAIHAGDWLVKLPLMAVILSVWRR
jgi:uncharacterized protein DUF1761